MCVRERECPELWRTQVHLGWGSPEEPPGDRQGLAGDASREGRGKVSQAEGWGGRGKGQASWACSRRSPGTSLSSAWPVGGGRWRMLSVAQGQLWGTGGWRHGSLPGSAPTCG